jgi:glycosyltransferase involved in cell wall biosynthesis
MKILVCHNFYRRHGGADVVMLHTQEFLEGRGHEVIPFAMQHPENLSTPYSRYFVQQVDYATIRPWHVMTMFRESARILGSPEARRNILALIRDARPDLAHCHNIYHELGGPSVLTPLKEAGIPVVLTLHDYKLICPNMKMQIGGEICERCLGGNFFNAVRYNCVHDSRLGSMLCAVEGFAHRKLYRTLIDTFISPSQFLKGKMVEAGFPAERIVHIPNAVPIASRTPEFKQGEYALYLGLLIQEKGLHVLVEAMKSIPQVPLKIAGRGYMEGKLRDQIERLGLKNVEMVGFVTGERLEELVHNCRFVVMPSIWYENYPMTILDAFSWGKAVIGSNLGGIPELVIPGETGLLAEPGDPEDLAAKMAAVWENPELAVEMGRKGRTRIETELSPEVYIDRVLKVYESVKREA